MLSFLKFQVMVIGGINMKCILSFILFFFLKSVWNLRPERAYNLAQ